jgi:DNA polymerase III sliding clamp (beta) subunit (PCNA family)
MVVEGNGMETKVWMLPYEESSIDKNSFIQAFGKAFIVTSVKGNEGDLVRLILPENNTEVVIKASQLITAIKKCVL